MAAKKNSRIWDYVNAASHSKDRSVLDDPDFDKVYLAFIINRSLAGHEDCVLAAQMMNERSELPPKVQFEFFLNTLRPRKRFGAWLKSTDSEDASAVAEYYDCSLRHAFDLVSLHSSDQLTIIRARLEKGGTTNKVRGHGK